MSRVRTRGATVALAAALALVAVAVGQPLAALLVSWALLVPSMPAGTRVRQAVLALLTLFATNALVLTVFSLAHHDTTGEQVVLATFALGSLLHLTTPRTTAAIRLSDPTDRVALLFGLVTFVVLYRPYFGASLGRTMALMSKTTDGATHVQIVQAVMQAGGYVQLDPPSGLSPGVEHYPSALAGNLWVAVSLIDPTPSHDLTIRAVALTSVLTYALLCFVALLACLRVLGDEGFARRGRAAAGAAVTLALVAHTGVGTLLLHLDSYTQITAMLFVAALVALPSMENRSTWQYPLVLTAALTGVAQTWYLLLPVVALVGLVGLSARKVSRRVLAVWALPAAVTCGYALLTGPNAVSQVSLPGPSLLPTISGILGLLLASTLGAVFLLRVGSSTQGPRLDLAAALVGCLLTTMLVIALESASGEGAGYYTRKLLMTSFFFGCVAAAVLVGAALAASRRDWLAPAAAVVLVGVATASWTTRGLTWPPAPTKPTRNLDGAVLDALVATHPDGLPDSTDVWVVDGCDRPSDQIASKWLYDLSLAWTPARVEALFDFATSRPDDVSALVARAGSGEVASLEVYVHRECRPDVTARLAQLSQVRIIRVP